MKLVDALNEFLAWLAAKGYSPATVKIRRLYGREFVGFLRSRGLMDVEEVTRAHVAEWQAWVWGRVNFRPGRPLSDTTRRHHLEAVKGLYKFLLDRKLLMIDPSAALVIPKVKEHLPRDIPTVKEMEEILSRPDIGTPLGLRDRAMLELAYSTGLRRGELADLDIYDVDLMERTVRVREGKGGKGRTAALTRTACEFLSRYITEARPRLARRVGRVQAGRAAVSGLAPSNHFPGSPARVTPKGGAAEPLGRETGLWLTRTGERLKKDALGVRVARYVRGVRPGTGSACHCVRHAFATHMLQGGADIRLVQEMLGHVKIGTTERYTRVKPMDLKAAHRKHHPRGTWSRGAWSRGAWPRGTRSRVTRSAEEGK
jgi:integrase/recombinase XerD